MNLSSYNFELNSLVKKRGFINFFIYFLVSLFLFLIFYPYSCTYEPQKSPFILFLEIYGSLSKTG